MVGSVCKFCGAEKIANSRFCHSCGNRFSIVDKFSDFEVGRIASLRDLRLDVFKSLSFFGFIITIMASYGLYEAISARVSEDIKDEIDSHLEEVKQRISEEEKVIRDILRSSQIEVATQISTIQAESNLRLKDLDKLKTQSGFLIRDLENIKQNADLSIRELNDLVSSVSIGLQLEDIVNSFFTIRDISIRTEIEFKPDRRDSFERLRSAFYFQVNIRSNGRNLVQFLPNGDRPIFVGGNSITHQHVMYPIYIDRLLGRDISLINAADLVELNFSFVFDKTNPEDISRAIRSIQAVKVHIYVNGIAVSQLNRRLTEDEKRNLKEYRGDIYVIDWKQENLLGDARDLYAESMRKSVSRSQP